MKGGAKLPRVPLLYVATPAARAGLLAKDGQHSFTYDVTALESNDRALEISLTMPLRPASYTSTPMLPVFQTFLPEGFVRERIVERFSKLMRIDDMALLALTQENTIGRLRLARTSNDNGDREQVESLDEILQDQGSRDLFQYLSDKYLIGSGIAGVQPKVLVLASETLPGGTSKAKLSIGERATLRARQFIVKVASEDFPGLAENEYHCLNIAASMQIEVPPFHLSADRRRLVIERFDRDPEQHHYLGFEDMVSLQGKTNDRKYEGSYEGIARTIVANGSAALRATSLARYFASLVLSMALRNGDAHLKNFGMLYTDPGSDDCRLSPVYDIVCTTIYLPMDRPALALAGERQWPDRATLAEFGRRACLVERPERVIDATLDTMSAYRPDDDASGLWAHILRQVDPARLALSR